MLAIALLAAGAVPSAAVIGANDVVPAATLLLPYFEVDLAADPGTGRNTRATVVNTHPAPTLVRVTLWTDHGLPTFAYTLFMTGFDVATVDLRDLFVDGSLSSVPAGVPFSQGTTSGEDPCASLPSEVPEEDLPDLQRAHQGLSSSFFGSQCGAVDYGDGLARGFITFDNTSECSEKIPGDDDYFVNGGDGVANNFNHLWGEYQMLDPQNGMSHSQPAVHVEASSTDPSVTTGGDPTFYARLIGTTAADNREPLSSTWGARYFNGLTDLVCWRDLWKVGPFSCEIFGPAQTHGFTSPAEVPYGVIVYDHDENPSLLDGEAHACPASAGRFTIGGAGIPVAPKTGWLHIDADSSGAALSGFARAPRQTYVTTIHRIHPAGLSASAPGVVLQGSGPVLSEAEPAGDASQ